MSDPGRAGAGGRRARGRGAWRALHAALCALLDSDLEAAEAALSGLVRGDSNQVAGYLALAQLFCRRGEVGRAIRIHQNLLLRGDLKEQERFAALSGLARDYQQGGFLRRAVGAWRDVLARNPRDGEALAVLAELAVDLRDFDLALDALRRLTRLGRLARRAAAAEGEAGAEVAAGPAGAGVEQRLLLRLAEAALDAGRTGDARRWLRRALRGDPQLAAGWSLLGVMEARRGRLPRALDAWQRALVWADSGEAAEVLRRAEFACGSAGDAAALEEFLRGRLAARDDDVAARAVLIRCMAARGAADEALELAEQGLAFAPRALILHAARARVLLDEGREAESAKALDALLGLLARGGWIPADALQVAGGVALGPGSGR